MMADDVTPGKTSMIPVRDCISEAVFRVLCMGPHTSPDLSAEGRLEKLLALNLERAEYQEEWGKRRLGP
jgi:hypothetical protein